MRGYGLDVGCNAGARGGIEAGDGQHDGWRLRHIGNLAERSASTKAESAPSLPSRFVTLFRLVICVLLNFLLWAKLTAEKSARPPFLGRNRKTACEAVPQQGNSSVEAGFSATYASQPWQNCGSSNLHCD